MNSDYLVTSLKDDNYLNGVSTLDLVMIQRHILGIELLANPYRVIAADVNNSESVDGLDLVELRKLILGIYNELPQNTSWRFVDSDYIFPDVLNPFPYDENVDLYNLQSNINDADFVGVKIGDVDASALPNAQSVVVENRNKDYKVAVVESLTEKGNKRIQFRTSDEINLAGLQMEIGIGSGNLLAVVPMKLQLEDANIAWDLVDDKFLRISWNDSDVVTAEADEILFEILLDKTGSISKTENVFNEIYTEEGGSIVTRKMGFTTEELLTGEQFSLDQNIPNPFKDVTTIGYNLPQDEMVTLIITDVDGKHIHKEERQGLKGYNEIDVKADLVNGAGVLYYQLKAGKHIASKKMIILK